MVKSNEVEEKIKSKTYPRLGVARAVIKRASFSRSDKARLLELADQTYMPEAAARVTQVVPTFSVDVSSAYPSPAMDRLDQQLLLIAFKMLGLCIEHKLSREEIYKRLEERLKAGMG